MPISKLRKIYKDFNSTISESFEMVKVMNELSDTKISRIASQHIYFTYELAFIKIFTGWERFLQESFISYMSGSYLSRYRPKLYLKKVSSDHALKILSGTEDYPDWSKIEEVYTLAELFFVKGEPFTMPLREIEIYFIEMKRIRNAIVHISSKAREKFEGLIRAKLPSYRSDISPGEFLGLSSRRGKTETFMEYYVSFLETASNKIIYI